MLASHFKSMMQNSVSFLSALFMMATVLSCRTFASTQEFSYADFKNIVLSPEISTIPQTLEQLPQSLKKNYTLMSQSESIQRSSPISPRAILFGSTGKFILTFNGDPRHLGYNGLETASFDEATRRIFFRKVVYRAESDSKWEWNQNNIAKLEGLDPVREVELFNDRVLISKPNPMLCMGCHAAHPLRMAELAMQAPENRLAKYNWNQYRDWPGAYGRDDDDLNSLDFRSEQNQFQNFVRQNEKHPRYAQLYRPSSRNFVFPYYDRYTPRTLSNMPNTRLTYLLSVNYAKQMADVVKNTKWFQENENKILYDVAQCNGLDDKPFKLSPPVGYRRLKGYEDTKLSALQFIDASYGRLTLFKLVGYENYFSGKFVTPSTTLYDLSFSDVFASQLLSLTEDSRINTALQGVSLPLAVYDTADPDFNQVLREAFFLSHSSEKNKSRVEQICDVIEEKLKKR